LIGKLYLPVSGSGKVKIGQKIIVKFDNYPFQEYGTIWGKVKSVSELSNDNSYLVDVELPDTLKTNYGFILDFKHNMTGISEIVTEDYNLFERIFYKFRQITTKL
jgi:hypothetical protein